MEPDQVDTARRIAAAAAAEGAAKAWAERCEVHGLDLRDVLGLSAFIESIQRRYQQLVSALASLQPQQSVAFSNLALQSAG